MAFDPASVTPSGAAATDRAPRSELVTLLREFVAGTRPADPMCDCHRCDTVRKANRLLLREDAA